jgi:hypothetical protein
VITIEEILLRKSTGSGLKIVITAIRVPPSCLRDTSLSAKVNTNFADKRRSLADRSPTKATEYIIPFNTCTISSSAKQCV